MKNLRFNGLRVSIWILFLMFFIQAAFSQETKNDRVYTNTMYKYQVEIPSWLTINAGYSYLNWGGKLETNNEVKSGIEVKSFDKKDFTNYETFKKYILGSTFGEPMMWSKYHKMYSSKFLGNWKDQGESYFVSLLYGKHLLCYKYILIETSASYLWVEYSAPKEDYEANISKFDEFLEGFKTIS
jgi:hypothetical protein